MELKQLRYFVEIVEQKSMTAAAKKLFVSQPVLSSQLKELEKELGSVLLVRTSRHQELTQTGEILYERAKQLLTLEENTRHELKDSSDSLNGTLRLGILPSLSLSLFGNALTSFCLAHPSLSFSIKEGTTNELLNLLENGVIDIAFVRTPCALTSHMQTVSFPHEKIVIAFHKDFFSLPAQPDFTLRALKDEPVLISERFAPLFEHACLQEGFLPRYRCVATNMATVFAWAKKGLGIAVLPYTSLMSSHGCPLCLREPSNPLFHISLIMARMDDRYLPKQAELFYDYCAGLDFSDYGHDPA